MRRGALQRGGSLALSVLGLFLSGCAPELEKVSELEKLRVLGVKKDNPYALPGEDVTLSMLWYDGSPARGRPVLTAWIADPLCVNPPADSYAGCFAALSGGDSAGETPVLPTEPVELPLPQGDEFTVTLPDDIISSRPPPPQGTPRYGLAIAFFAVCAGERFVFDPGVREGIPILCQDANGEAVGSEGFVAGYTSIYSFEDIDNQNPVIQGFRFRGQDVDPDCTGTECITAEITPPDCDEPGAPCVPACPDDGDPSCEGYEIEAVVNQAESVETDDVAVQAYGRDFQEQIWTNYYVNGGSVKNEVKLVNDATQGFNTEQSTEFYAPSEPGPVTIWALVHDNRGGVEFVRFTIGVQ